MMLCEDTIGRYIPSFEPKAKIEFFDLVVGQDTPPPIALPKNKAAKRRFVQSIRDNVDKINKGTQFKKKGQPLPVAIAKAVRAMK